MADIFRSTVFSAQQCKELDGYYNHEDKSCYYGVSRRPVGTAVCRYFVNRKCYSSLDTSYTSATCANIGGHFTASNAQGERGTFCYYSHFNCTFHAANQQCYRFRSATNDRSECDANHAGYYQHGYCYYECPDVKYLVHGRCYDARSADYTPDDCAAVGGHYADSYCHIDRCNYSVVKSHCYRYRTASYSVGTCRLVGGHYEAPYCYYSTFNCRHHPVNGQCFTRSSINQSRSACDAIPDSYYDDVTRTCYYHCTETLGECFVGASSSFGRDMCDLIGGVYSDGTCYYVTLDCPGHRTADGRCFANRSSTLTCNTCLNIGGQYEHGYCYYYRDNCTGYVIDRQCYSSRSQSYTVNPCNDLGGLYRDGFCYHEPSKCGADWHYRNCSCFRHFSPEKTPATCANIGGYYDLRTRRCFYNSSTCPYHAVHAQCFRHMDDGISRTLCLHIGGYHARKRTGHSLQRSYACYYNQVNCSLMANDRCYVHFSASYNKGTCESIAGYYSDDDQGCFYNTFSCRYSLAGQCYDRAQAEWSRAECEAVHGYFDPRGGTCFVSRHYCRHVVTAHRKCSVYASPSYDCSSCRLLDGFLHSGTCYHNSESCTEPLFLAANDRCYENRTAVRTASECRSMPPGESFFDDDAGWCYFTFGPCASTDYYVNCGCYRHRSPIYTAGSCANFGGHYADGICYYNSSHCPASYHSTNGQCYRQTDVRFTPSTCRNIGGHYHSSSVSSGANDTTARPSAVAGTCYYNSFNCSGFTVRGPRDGLHCFVNRSTTYSSVTCAHIGGVYAYTENGTHYRPAADETYSRRRSYYCLYDTFNCAR